MGLNSKQKLFVKEYLKDKNAARAARAVGYSIKSAREMGRQLLTKLDIRTAVDKGLAELASRADISAERNLRRMADIAYHDKKAKRMEVLKACELIGKHLGMFKEITEVTGKDGGPQVIAYMPDNGRKNISESKV